MKLSADMREEKSFHEERLKEQASLAINLAMTEAQVRRIDLANRLGCSRSYITKVLERFPNLTLAKFAGIMHALGYCVNFTISRKNWGVYVPQMVKETGANRDHPDANRLLMASMSINALTLVSGTSPSTDLPTGVHLSPVVASSAANIESPVPDA